MDERTESGSGATDPVCRWKVGEVILGRYVVERELGQGELGVVYACMDQKDEVRVAVRGLPPELSRDSMAMEELQKTVQRAERLRNPNIAGPRALEKDERGDYYLVTDLADGVSLRKWLGEKRRGGKVGLSEAAAVLRQVAAALDYAHWARVTHGDVRPENVMIDEQGWVKVLDFGLSKALRTSGREPYRAPELWEGQPQSADADQYALGVMAYEMLLGRLPFENSDSEGLRDAVLHGEVRDIPGVSEYAMRALRRAMAKREEERFRSCGSFVEALAGRGRRRSGRGQSLMVWVVVLVLIGAGAWLVRGRVIKMVRRAFPPKQEVVREAIAKTEVAEEVASALEEAREEVSSLEESMREEAAFQEELPEIAADEPPALPEEVRPEVVAPEAATEIVADAGESPAIPEEMRPEAASPEVEAEHAQMQELTQEEQEAAVRAERMGRRLVQAAGGYRDSKQWTKCLAAADAALSADPENAEAKALKAEAEEKLRPRIALLATLNGQKVNATVTKGMAHAGRTTPIMVNIKKGGAYGFMAEYEADGKKYVGRTVVEAKERGVTGAVIVLHEVKGAQGAQ